MAAECVISKSVGAAINNAFEASDCAIYRVPHAWDCHCWVLKACISVCASRTALVAVRQSPFAIYTWQRCWASKAGNLHWHRLGRSDDLAAHGWEIFWSMAMGETVSWHLGHSPLPVLANCLAAQPSCNPYPDISCDPGETAPAGPADPPAAGAWVALLCDPDYVIILAPPDPKLGGAAPAHGGGSELEQAQRAGFEPRQVQRLGFGRAAGMVCDAAWAPGGAALAVACQRALFVAAVARGPGVDAMAAKRGGAGAPAADNVAAAEGAQGTLGSSGAASARVGGAAAACAGQDVGGLRGNPAADVAQGSQGHAEQVLGHAGQGAPSGSDALELVLRIPLFFWPKAVTFSATPGEEPSGCLRLALAGAPGVVLYRVAPPQEVSAIPGSAVFAALRRGGSCCCLCCSSG